MTDPSAAIGRVELTSEGREQLQAELDHLLRVARPALIDRIRQARLFLAPEEAIGIVDIAERDLAIIDGRIAELNAILGNAHIIGDGPGPPTVQPGFPVRVSFADGISRTLTIVSPLEANPSRNFISRESPAARAMLGKAPGDTVGVDVGGETVALTIESLAR